MPHAPPRPIAFIDLLAQRRRLGARIDAAVSAALEGGQWIMGPQVAQFERALAAFCGASHALACANGTDALALPLMAWGIGPGDAVFCPSFTFCATAEVVPWFGAEPVFVDVEPDTFTLSPDHLEAAIRATLAEGRLTPKAVIGVCLFGQPADYRALAAVCRRYGLKLIADAAQGFGATQDGARAPAFADATTTSFFPAKPLGAYGDGGAILCNDGAFWELLDSLRLHGKATAADIAAHAFAHEAKYLNPRVGMNSRLDTLQAAILLEKLAVFPEEIEARNRIAARYAEGLAEVCATPVVRPGAVSTWAQYTIQIEARDAVAAALKADGVPTAVYYPIPLHRQGAYAHHPIGPGGLPVTEALAPRVLSLPMHADLDADTQDYIIDRVRAAALAPAL